MKQASPLDGLTGHHAFHYAAVGLLLALIAYSVIKTTFFGSVGWSALLLIPASIYVADVLSGILHFFLDYRLTTANSGLKELYFYKGDKGSKDYLKQRASVMKTISPLEKVVFDFKTHHLSPGALGRRTFLRLLMPVLYPITLPLMTISVVLHVLGQLPDLAMLFLGALNGALTLAQYAHSCAHRRQVPAVVAVLQATHLFMTAEQHKSHHNNLGIDFCILNGWGNLLVNRIFNFCKSRGWIEARGLEPI